MNELNISNPFFSIILPTYNSESTIKRCIDSILCQTLTDFEIVIVDGLSKDATLTILKKFNDSRIKIFSESDKGIYDAMNKGINQAKGNWLYFLGSDDSLYDINVLNKIYMATLSTKRLVIYGNVKVLGDAVWASNGTIADGYFSIGKLISKNICHQAIFYNKMVFSKIGNYNTDFTVCADWEYNLRCRAKYEFEYVNIVIANFYSGGTGDLQKEGNLSIYKHVLKYFKWQFYKIKFKPDLIIILKFVILKRRIDIMFILFPQLIISFFIHCFSVIKSND